MITFAVIVLCFCVLMQQMAAQAYLATALANPIRTAIDVNGDLLFINSVTNVIQKLFLSNRSVVNVAMATSTTTDPLSVNLTRPVELAVEANGNVIIMEDPYRIVRWTIATGRVSLLRNVVNTPLQGLVIDGSGHIVWLVRSSCDLYRMNPNTLSVTVQTLDSIYRAQTGVCLDVALDGRGAYIISSANGGVYRFPSFFGQLVAGGPFVSLDYHNASDTLFAVTGSDSFVYSIRLSTIFSYIGIPATMKRTAIVEPATSVTVSSAGTVYLSNTGSGTLFTTRVCPNNTYLTSTSNTVCTPCPVGTCSLEGASSVSECTYCNLDLTPLSPRTLLLTSAYRLTFDHRGDLLIVARNDHQIRKVNVTTGEIEVVAGSGFEGSQDARGTQAGFIRPVKVIEDANSDLWVLEADRIRYIAEAGRGRVATLAIFGPYDMSGFDLDVYGNIVWCEAVGHVVRFWNMAHSNYSILAGALSAPGNVDHVIGTAARFNTPMDLIVYSPEHYVVADYGNRAIRVVMKQGTTLTMVLNISIATISLHIPTNTIYGVSPINSIVYAIRPIGVTRGHADVLGNTLPNGSPAITGIALDWLGNLVFSQDSGSIRATSKCMAGSMTSSRGFCVKCGANRYAPADSFMCFPCPAGLCSPAGSTNAAACTLSACTSSLNGSSVSSRLTPFQFFFAVFTPMAMYFTFG